MSRYIDLEAFDDWYDDGYDLYASYDALHSAPSTDIVFCKECRHWHDHITTTWCSRGAELRPQESGWIKRNADDFCSYGERE